MKLNFNDEKTYITEYRIKDSKVDEAQVIVKTASGDYYTAPYTREDLDTIRSRMIQEHFDAAEYKSNIIDKLTDIMGLVIGFASAGAGFSVLASGTNMALGGGALACSAVKILWEAYEKVKLTRQLRKVKQMEPNLAKHDICFDNKREAKINSEHKKTNILFYAKDFERSISSTSLKHSFFHPEEEQEYTLLTSISESETNWNNLPEYHNYNEEINNASKKDIQTLRETYAQLKQEYLEEYYKAMISYTKEVAREESIQEGTILNNTSNYGRGLK